MKLIENDGRIVIFDGKEPGMPIQTKYEARKCMLWKFISKVHANCQEEDMHD